MPLPSWWQVTLPHADIRSTRKLDESIFAADLGQVARGEAHHDYQDPVRFFAGTFLSEGLRALLRDALAGLAGVGAGNRVIQIETPFGGGKTHTLLALYHLARDGAALRHRPEIAELLAEVKLDAVPETRVSAVVGTDPSVVAERVWPDGTHTHTLWGQIAWELGGRSGYERLRSADEARVAPGADALRALLAAGPPKLILMDELVNYVVGAGAVHVGATTLKDQTIAFLQQLTQAVAQTPRALLLLTIPSSQTEIYGQAARDFQQEVFATAGQIGEVVGRIQTVRTPVQGDDIYEVLRRRLLEQPVDERDRAERERRAREIAMAYVRMYALSPNDFLQEAQEPAYVERMVRAYPFHPEVVRVLYERWGTLPDFQRTRGALRILGMTLADLFAANSREPVILPCHLNLAPGDLRNELVRVLDNPAFNNVIDSDIAGSSAKTRTIDGRLGREHERFHPAERTATTIFMWSFSGAAGETRGATDAQVRLGVLTPEMQPAIVGNVLNEFRRMLWYFHVENNTYRFDTRVNLNRVIVQKEEAVTGEMARKLVEDQLREITTAVRPRSGPATGLFAASGAPEGARTFLFPTGSQDVADAPGTAIVVLRPRDHAPAGTQLNALPPLVGEIMLRYGDRPRQYRNTIAVLVPDSALVAEADNAARRLIALRSAQADRELALPEHQRDELKEMLRVASEAFPLEISRLYRSVIVPAGPDKGGMERFDLGIRTTTRGAALWDDAFAWLRQEERHLDSLSPSLLASNYFQVWPRDTAYVSTQRLWDAFVQFPHLPMLAGKQVLIDAIARGCDEGLLGYAVGDAEGPPFQDGRFGSYNRQLSVELGPASWVLTADYARATIVPQTKLIHEIPPTLLRDAAIWPTGSSRRSLADVWTALEKHYAPAKIASPGVLAAAVHQGVADRIFRVAVDRGEPAADASVLPLGDVESLARIELVQPDKTPDTRPRFLQIDVRNVDTMQVSKIVTGVIMPLKSQGATITLRLVIDADAPGGIDPAVLELTIKETFKQLGLSPDYEVMG